MKTMRAPKLNYCGTGIDPGETDEKKSRAPNMVPLRDRRIYRILLI